MGDHAGNRNGSDKPEARQESPLEEVERRLSQVAAEEAGEVEVDSSQDPVHGWKKRDSVSLEDLREGLIAVSKISEAAIEGGLKMSADLRRVVGPFQVAYDQIRVLGPKIEANAQVINKVDADLAKMGKDVHQLKKSVQALQVDMQIVKENVSLLPAMKEMLGEIIARLPEPGGKKQ